MPSTQRHYRLQGGFAAGILSPSSQDADDSEVYLYGLSDLRNFVVRRDGSISARRAFIRGADLDLLNPSHGIIPTNRQAWRIGGRPAPRVVTFEGSPGGTPESAHESIYMPGGDGVYPFQRVITIVQPDTSADFLRINLQANQARAITLHGVQIRQGKWFTTVETVDDQGDEVTYRELTFAAYAAHRGGSRYPLQPMLTHETATAHGHPARDPFVRGVFAPGIVRRDIVLPLSAQYAEDPAVRALERPDVRYVALRVAQDTAERPIVLSIEGVSAWSEGIPETFPDLAVPIAVDGQDHDPPPYGDAWRVIPWTVQDEPFALLLGMEQVRMYHVPAGRPPVEVSVFTGWQFSPKQLRELTWAGLGNSLLLLHRDFPWPIRVFPPTAAFEGLRVEYFRLQNVPRVPPGALADSAVDVQTRGGVRFITTGTATLGVVPNLQLTPAPVSLLVAWDASAADYHKVLYSTKAAYDASTSIAAWAQEASTTTEDVPAGLTEHAIMGVMAGTEYAVAAQGFIENVDPGMPDIEGPIGRPEFESPLGEALPNVENLLVVPSTTHDGHLDITWDPVAGATHYEAQWTYEGSTVYADVVRNGAAITTTNVELRAGAGSTYVIRVRARGEHRSASAMFTVSEPVTAQSLEPAVPTGLEVVNSERGDAQFTVTWDVAARADGYDLYVRKKSDPEEDARVSDVGTRRQLEVAGELDEAYVFQVRSWRGLGRGRRESAYSAPVEETARLIASRPPILSAFQWTRTATINLAWTAQGAAPDQWEIQAREPNGTFRPISGSPAAGSITTVLYTGVAGQRYEFRVRGLRGTGAEQVEGPWSNVASAVAPADPTAVPPPVIPPPPPPPVDPEDPEPPPPEVRVPATPPSLRASLLRGDILLEWGASSGATTYEYRWQRGSTTGEWTVVNVGGVRIALLANPMEGATYYFQVSARNSAGASEWSGTVSLAVPVAPVAPPGRVSGLSVTLDGNGNVAISWSPLAAADTYEYDWRIGSGDRTVVPTGEATSHTITNPEPSSTYGIRVRARNQGGVGPWSTTRTVTTGAAPVTPPPPMLQVPAVPTGLTARINSRGGIDLSWHQAARATSYEYEWRRGESARTRYSTGSATSHTIATPTQGVTYYFRVRGVNTAGASDWSSEVSVATTRTTNPPNVPRNLRARTTGTAGQIAITWSAPSGGGTVDRYRVGIWSAQTGWVRTPRTGTSWTTNVVEGRAYAVTIRAENADGNSGWFTPNVNVWVPPATTAPPPTTPVGLQPPTAAPYTVAAPSTANPGTIFVNWNAVTRATRYRVAIRAQGSSGNGTETAVGGLTAHTYTVTPGSAQEVRVRGENAGGSGPWTAWIPVVAAMLSLPAIPTGFTVRAVGVTIAAWWNAVDTATGYDIRFRYTDLNRMAQDVTTRYPTNLFTWNSPRNTRVTLNVRAVNAAGVSAWSQSRSVTATSGDNKGRVDQIIQDQGADNPSASAPPSLSDPLDGVPEMGVGVTPEEAAALDAIDAAIDNAISLGLFDGASAPSGGGGGGGEGDYGGDGGGPSGGSPHR